MKGNLINKWFLWTLFQYPISNTKLRFQIFVDFSQKSSEEKLAFNRKRKYSSNWVTQWQIFVLDLSSTVKMSFLVYTFALFVHFSVRLCSFREPFFNAISGPIFIYKCYHKLVDTFQIGGACNTAYISEHLLRNLTQVCWPLWLYFSIVGTWQKENMEYTQ